MKQNYKRVDIGLFLLILLFLAFPLLQGKLHLKKWEKSLKGAFTSQPDTTFNWKDWFDEGFQKQKERFITQHFGFRSYYVMLNNQIDYTFFKKINADHVVMGKAGVFFEDSYINAYYGKNFTGEKNLEALASKLKKAQDILKSNGIDLEIIFLPGKATFFSEFIPDNYKTPSLKSNYSVLTEKSKKANLNFIDFNQWFLQMKRSTVYDLYPSGGIHWSNYGALLAFDSLRKAVERNCAVVMREFIVTNVNVTTDLQSPDNDIAEALNLWRDIKPLSMPYAEYIWNERPGEIKPKALFVGDSYFWNWYYQGLVNNCFSDAQFWYYNQTAYPEDLKNRDVKKIPFKEAVSANKVVVLMATESNIHDIGWGFADEVIKNFRENEATDNSGNSQNTLLKEFPERRRIYIAYFINEINNTPDWLSKVKAKAREKNISLEEMVANDAEYLYETSYCNQEVISYTEQTKERIRKDKGWMKQIEAKAMDKKISVEEMLELDAKYLYDTEGKK